MTRIPCPLHRAALRSRHRTAIESGEGEIAYGELDRRVSAIAAHLRAAGFRPGDRVALYLENGVPAILLILALWRIRAIACPLSARLPPEGVRDCLRLIRGRKLIARVGAARRALPQDVAIEDPDALVAHTRTATPPDEDFHFDPDQPVSILFTSGSAGAPKAVLHSMGNHYYSARGANRNVRLRPGDRWLLSLPLCHVGGLGILFRCLQSGAGIVSPDPAASIRQSLERHRITHLSLVQTQLHRLIAAGIEPEIVSRLKAVMLGGGPVSAELIRAAQERHWPLRMTYGLTEMSSQVTAMRPDSPPARRATSGVLLPYRDLAIDDSGQILVKGATLFQGYARGDEVHRPVDGHGWFATGDLGFMDEDGYLTVSGRRDNLFVSGGENIHPEELEGLLASFPGVTRAVVVPADDPEFGSRPVAFVQAGREAWKPEEWTKRMRDILPGFKVPRQFRPWPEGAEAAGLKISRATLRERANDVVGKE